jgi:hypothetical protein
MSAIPVKVGGRGRGSADPPDSPSCHDGASQRAEADQHSTTAGAAFRGGERGVSGCRRKLDRDGLPACNPRRWCLECRWPSDACRVSRLVRLLDCFEHSGDFVHIGGPLTGIVREHAMYQRCQLGPAGSGSRLSSEVRGQRTALQDPDPKAGRAGAHPDCRIGLWCCLRAAILLWGSVAR